MRLTRLRIASLLPALLALGLAGLSPAAAQSPMCADLQAQYLAALGSSRGSAPNSGQTMVAMQQLSRDLANAQVAAQQGNCNRFLFFGPRPSPQCPAIMATISRIQQQMAQARSQQQRGLFVTSPQSERDRLLGILSQYGCEIPSSSGGGQRTLCVRICDGFYFPISFSANRQRYSRDAEVCQSMYAQAGQAELFAQSGGDVANAVSTSGQRYGDQPYAFLYRHGFFPVCDRQLKDGVVALGERYWGTRGGIPQPPPQATPQRAAPLVALAGMPMPRLRPTDRQEDPETVANRAGRFDPLGRESAGEGVIVVAGRSMRMVGADYYIDLYDPTKPPPPVEQHRGPLGFDLIGSAMAAESTGASGLSELR